MTQGLCGVLLGVGWLLLGVPAAAANELAQAALARTTVSVAYDGAYRRIEYPGGDVPANIGVCTDVVIRALRALGTDLQQLVHEDMSAHFDLYPAIWGMTRPDTNIDHRRVPNLEVFFARHGKSLPPSRVAQDHQPGDIVSWRLPNGRPHIGIVGPDRVPDSTRYLVVHNIGAGPQSEDVLLKFDVYGHYRFGSVE
ncbi:MAG: DUF1287 domain-containing protein [Gammaproteobacteria bacterium]